MTADPASRDLTVRAWQLFDMTAAEWLLGLVAAEQLVGAAVAALAVGCDSGWLASIAGLREENREVILSGLFGAFRERGIEFPLRDDALRIAAETALALMVAGVVTPEQASAKLWSVADRDHDFSFAELREFRDLAISLSLHEDPDCDFDLDLSEWRAAMLTRAGWILDRGGLGAGGDFWSDGVCDDA